MGKILRYILYLVVLVACNSPQKIKEYGNLRCNAFWFYNNFVGNRPDAGASAFLYSLQDSTLKYDATADVRGDFSFDSIPVGKYLLIVRSNAATDQTYNKFLQIYENRDLLKRVYPPAGNILVKDSLDFINAMWKVPYQHDNSKDEFARMDEHRHRGEEIFGRIGLMYSTLPNDKIKQSLFGYGAYTAKLKFSVVEIKKGNNSPVVIDFGASYY